MNVWMSMIVRRDVSLRRACISHRRPAAGAVRHALSTKPGEKCRLAAALVGILAAAIPPALVAASASQVDTTQRFLLLATQRTGTMQEELDEAAAAGYRIVVGSPTSGTEMAVIMEKVATPPDTFEYRLLATTRTSTMQEEISEAAAEGYRLLPSTMVSKERMFGGPEIVLVMEKAPNSSATYEYLLLATNLTSTLQREMSEAIEQGYVVVGMVSRDEHIAILERSSE